MFELEKTFSFEAGHSLVHHDGKCREPHGHSYTFTLLIRTDKLIASGPKTNMVMDFADISTIVKPMIEDYLDHHWLNESLQCDSPSAEFIAKWIFDHLAPLLPGLAAISVNETTNSKVTYRIA